MNLQQATIISMIILSGCGSDTNNNVAPAAVTTNTGVIKVYKSDGSTQCYDSSITLESMRTELIGKGIDVICSQKGNTGLIHPAVCGGETGNINIYSVHAQNLQDAIEIGFSDVSQLTEYKDEQCLQ